MYKTEKFGENFLASRETCLTDGMAPRSDDAGILMPKRIPKTS